MNLDNQLDKLAGRILGLEDKAVALLRGAYIGTLLKLSKNKYKNKELELHFPEDREDYYSLYADGEEIESPALDDISSSMDRLHEQVPTCPSPKGVVRVKNGEVTYDSEK